MLCVDPTAKHETPTSVLVATKNVVIDTMVAVKQLGILRMDLLELLFLMDLSLELSLHSL